MKAYENPEIIVVRLSCGDVMSGSGNTPLDMNDPTDGGTPASNDWGNLDIGSGL